MKFAVARHVFGVVAIGYAGLAVYANFSQGQPVDINWLIKVFGVAVVGAVVGFGPELLQTILNAVIGGFIPALPTTSAVDNEQAVPLSPSIFRPQPLPAVKIDTVSVTESGDDHTKTTKVVTTNSSLLVDLLYAANGDQELIEQIKVLNDGLFRKSTEKVGADQ